MAKRFNRSLAEQIVKQLCEEHIRDYGNTLYKNLPNPVGRISLEAAEKTYEFYKEQFGPKHVYNFCSYVEKVLFNSELVKHPHSNTPLCNFTLSQNLIPLFYKYGMKVDIVLITDDGIMKTLINTDDMEDYVLYHKYGIPRYGFKESIKTNLEYKEYVNDQNKVDTFINSI